MRDEMDTPVGRIFWVEEGGALRQLGFIDRASVKEQTRGEVRARLRAYFDGDVEALEKLRVALDGTPFQKRVWAALREIPPGVTRSYGELARAIGSPSAVRAVGAANGKNPVSLVVPCHRVIGSNGKLVGYFWGVERKRWLLAHEGAVLC